MVVGKKEAGDIKFDRESDLILKGKTFENQNTYSDKKAPNRRDIFPGSKVKNKYDNLPKSGKAVWMGKKYDAKLSFRYGKGGRKIPVYQFFIKK